MLDIVHGSVHSSSAGEQLAEALRQEQVEGTLYLGFPVIPTADEPIVADALLLSRQTGLVLFTFPTKPPPPSDTGGWESIRRQSIDVLTGIRSKLQREPGLCDDEGVLQSKPRSFVFLALAISPEWANHNKLKFITPNSISILKAPNSPLSEDEFKLTSAILQSISTLRPKKRRANATRPLSRGSIMKEIEREISNLDRSQRHGALETPEGPQRVRGLAGSGKTVVLALKAAYLQARNPGWKVAITFHTRSLKQQFEELVRRFSYELVGTEPDFSLLQILPAWGSDTEPGMYSNAANAAGVGAFNFKAAQQAFGRERAFEGACKDLVTKLGATPNIEEYDAILIDEAQDLPQPFFELVYHRTRQPKRIVWAYDELQNLSSYTMAGPETLFGMNADNQPRVRFTGVHPQKEDVILSVCYRNTPWALTTAHALGFGVYRKGGLVQYFDDDSLWTEIGYEHILGASVGQDEIALQRSPEATPGYFDRLIRPDDAVFARRFESVSEQYDWVADEIDKNLKQDELDPDDILVVFPDPITFASQSASLQRRLGEKNIASHQAGLSVSRDIFRLDNSVALSSIFRAKGNEAPMVYVVNSDFCTSEASVVRRRNTLFTAITRSRAWVRMVGVGSAMSLLEGELEQLKQYGYELRFDKPTREELAQMRKIHRDRTRKEQEAIERFKRGLDGLLKQLQSGEISLDDLPLETRERLSEFSGSDS